MPALEDRPGVHRLPEYEALANSVLARHRRPAICVYDARRFHGDTVVEVLRTHPMAIIGGTLRPNPFFTPPDEFLGELRERGPKCSGA